MTLNKNFFAISYLVLLTISIYTPQFDVYDKMSIQYLLMSISNIIAIIGFPFLFDKKELLRPLKHPLILFSLGYLIMGILSLIKSINIIESYVELGQVITFIITLFLLIFLVYERLIKINQILIILTITLLIDIAFSLGAYLQFVFNDVPYTLEENWRLVGQYGNRNILATVLSFKIPLVIILALRLKKNYMYIITFIILTLSFFNIALLSSRATYLAIITCIAFIFVISLIKYIKERTNIFSVNKSIILLYLIPCLIAYIMSFKAIDPGPQGNVVSRIATITSTNDSSKNTRLRYYAQSLTHISKNPLLGAGIGNWKILSIKYDSENIQNYIIPYNAHNDILEATAETGIIGGLSFLLFFLLILYYLYQLLIINIFTIDKYSYTLLLILPFLVYFIDLNLNFPSARPANQFFLLMYICIILSFKMKMNEEK